MCGCWTNICEAVNFVNNVNRIIKGAKRIDCGVQNSKVGSAERALDPNECERTSRYKYGQFERRLRYTSLDSARVLQYRWELGKRQMLICWERALTVPNVSRIIAPPDIAKLFDFPTNYSLKSATQARPLSRTWYISFTFMLPKMSFYKSINDFIRITILRTSSNSVLIIFAAKSFV